jgi:hypothetical protein
MALLVVGGADEYRILKKAVASHKIAAGKAKRAKIVLLSPTRASPPARRLSTLPIPPLCGCLSTRSRDIVVKANR